MHLSRFDVKAEPILGCFILALLLITSWIICNRRESVSAHKQDAHSTLGGNKVTAFFYSLIYSILDGLFRFSNASRNRFTLQLFVFLLLLLPFVVRYLQIQHQDVFPFAKVDVNLIVTVDAYPQSRSWGTRTRFVVEQVWPAGANNESDICEACLALTNRKLLLNDYAGHADDEGFIPGQRYRLTARLKPPLGFHNPAGFDYERWLYSHEIAATGYIRESKHLLPYQIGVLNKYYWQTWFVGFFHRLEGIFQQQLFSALMMSDKSWLDQPSREFLQVSGLMHLFVVSGLHIGLIYMALVSVLSALVMVMFASVMKIADVSNRYASVEWLSGHRVVIVSRMITVIALVMVWAYVWLIDFPVPAVRAVIFISLWKILQIATRSSSGWMVLFVTAYLVLVWKPEEVVSFGFWMSFLAVSSILLIYWGKEDFKTQFNRRDSFIAGWQSKSLELLKIQCSISLVLAPFMIWMGSAVSFLGFFLNLLFIPLFSLVIIPITLAAMLGSMVMPDVALWLLQPLAGFLEWLIVMVMPLADSTFVTINNSPPVASLLVALVILMPLPWLFKVPTSVLYVMLLSFPVTHPFQAAASTKMIMLDVGQATSVAFIKGDRALLYDTGFGYKPIANIEMVKAFNAADAVIIPTLKSEGVSTLDLLIVSHGDLDHAGGFDALARSYYVPERILAYHDFESEFTSVLSNQSSQTVQPLKNQVCYQGQSFRWHDLNVDVLWPPEDPVQWQGIDRDSNNASCVVLINKGALKVLLTGDISAEVEQQLIELSKSGVIPSINQVDILMLAHHGSKTSSSEDFIGYTAPDLALISAGALSRFGHPHHSVVDRLNAHDVPWLNTANQGAIEIPLNRESYNSDGFSIENTPTQIDRIDHLSRFYWNTPRDQ
jgi:competence protein ComEC